MKNRTSVSRERSRSSLAVGREEEQKYYRSRGGMEEELKSDRIPVGVV